MKFYKSLQPEQHYIVGRNLSSRPRVPTFSFHFVFSLTNLFCSCFHFSFYLSRSSSKVFPISNWLLVSGFCSIYHIIQMFISSHFFGKTLFYLHHVCRCDVPYLPSPSKNSEPISMMYTSAQCAVVIWEVCVLVHLQPSTHPPLCIIGMQPWLQAIVGNSKSALRLAYDRAISLA